MSHHRTYVLLMLASCTQQSQWLACAAPLTFM
jgi:hypothetical protein